MNTNHFNKLTEAEQERLVKLQEECAELIAIISKTLLHGYESYDPTKSDRTINRKLIENECGDVRAEMDRLFLAKDLNANNVYARSLQRLNYPKYFHHQRKVSQSA